MVVNEEVNKLLEKGLLIPSKSPWAAPLLVVKKKDGSNRVVIDYRKLNNITRKDAYPLPRIDDALDCLGSAQFFSAMDLISGYWQVEMSPEDQEKCAIIFTQGLFNQHICRKAYATHRLPSTTHGLRSFRSKILLCVSLFRRYKCFLLYLY